MSTPKLTTKIPEQAFHDPLRTFDEATWRKTYGLGDNVQVDPMSGKVTVTKPGKKGEATKKSSYQSGSPSSKMHAQLSGKPKQYHYSKSGFILSDGIDTGNGRFLLSSTQRVKALGQGAHYDGSKKVWAPDILASSSYFQSKQAHGASLFARKSHRSESAPQRAAGPRKGDGGVKVPGFKLETGGPGKFKEGTFYRDRQYRLVPQKKN